MPLSYVEASVDEEEEDDEQNKRDNDNNKKKKKKKEAKGNRLLIFSFLKSKKRIVSKITRKPLSLNMSSSTSASSGFWKYVCFCGIESPNTLEWSSSCNSDPKDENFTIEMLRVLVQTNDFFSKDCNPHL
ncbi:hypothetical protein V5N11_023774 [Cardamine amara subsp. amara]|uniref:Uncharacterized protein n=1 Tax=Cardamine amara subsp. amara TaxID=228776 RepID=A0ABD1B4V5_CARAN